MSELVRDTVVVHGDPEAIWAIIDDPVALGRVLPGAESLEPTGPGMFRGVLASKIQFMTVRADVTAVFHDAERPRRMRLQLDGRPRGMAGSFRASIPFELEPSGAIDGRSYTRISYSVDLTVSGRLAVFGAPLMRDTMRRQIAQLVANMDRELAIR